jgi:hypothetical protein
MIATIFAQTNLFTIMAKDQTRRLKPADISTDTVSYDALRAVTGYNPVNTLYTLANIKTQYDSMMAAQTVETQAEKAFNTARDKATAAEWAFHNAILGAKDQVRAQFGKDSNELQAIGLKKVSEYKRPTRKKKE